MKRRATDNIYSNMTKRCKIELERLNVRESVELKEINLNVTVNENSDIYVVNNDDLFHIETKSDIVTISTRKYALRSRAKKQTIVQPIRPKEQDVVKKPEKKETQIVKFERQIDVNGEVFKLGEVVLAKTRGWCHWPALIEKIQTTGSTTEVIVTYFKTKESGRINVRNKKEKMLIKFQKGKQIIKDNILKYNGLFAGAVDEAELMIKEAKKGKKQ